MPRPPSRPRIGSAGLHSTGNWGSCWTRTAIHYGTVSNSIEEEIWKRERAPAVTEGIVDDDEAKVLVFLINVFDLDDPDDVD
jgi:hypothetical protein